MSRTARWLTVGGVVAVVFLAFLGPLLFSGADEPPPPPPAVSCPNDPARLAGQRFTTTKDLSGRPALRRPPRRRARPAGPDGVHVQPGRPARRVAAPRRPGAGRSDRYRPGRGGPGVRRPESDRSHRGGPARREPVDGGQP